MSEENQNGNGKDDYAFSASYDHEKKSGEIKFTDKPNVLVAAMSLFAMACVTTIAGASLYFFSSQEKE